MPWIARTPLKVGHDEETDTPIIRQPDEHIPEAEDWPWQLRRQYETNGRIREVETIPGAAAESAGDSFPMPPKRGPGRPPKGAR